MFSKCWCSLLAGVCSCLVTLMAGAQPDAGGMSPFELPGTQPGQLTEPLRDPGVCESCHGEYADYSPSDSWKGTMMANAARDPLFHAALAIANQDVPGSGDLCLRCHSPRAWLFGRSSPPELATLAELDYESVDCDFCHRLEPAEPLLIGTGQYTVANDFVRRGPFADSKSDHEAAYSAYHESSELCGLCHDVSNPAEGHFPIERTYTEWKNSAFPTEGVTCQSCHMPAQLGFAGGARGLSERTVHVHELAGGNTWMPLVLASEYPELDRRSAFERTSRAAKRQLQAAARLSLVEAPSLEADQEQRFVLRVENLSGHKLPTGYPEGRRCWLEVKVSDASGAVLMHSGRYDDTKADRIPDEQLRAYEVKMGRDGQEGFHFVLQNEILEDTRIPPRGFTPDVETHPVGRDYEELGTDAGGRALAHWDLAEYSFAVPPRVQLPLLIEARLWYQTTSRPYVEFLRDENRSDATGQKMYSLWEKHDRAPPLLMTALLARVPSVSAGSPAGPAPVDAGGMAPRSPVDGRSDAAVLDASVGEPGPLSDAGDSGFGATPEASDGGASQDVDASGPSGYQGGSGGPPEGGGCRCTTVPRPDPSGLAFGLLLALLAIRRLESKGLT